MKQIILALACAAGLLAPVANSLAQSAPPDKKSLEQAAAINTELAVAYLKQNNLSAARDTIDKALKQHPRTAQTQMTAGLVYDQLGDDKKALSHYNEAAKLGSGNPDVLNNVAVYLCRKGERKRGEQMFLKAAVSPLYKTPPVAYTNAGRCARADGRPKDAEQYFRKALSFKADQPDALQQLAEVTHEQGNNLQARAFLQRYLAAAPASASMLLLGVRIETALGDQAAAAEYGNRLTHDFASSTEAATVLQEQGARP
jgi:type IV pilus assembly protein PilF